MVSKEYSLNFFRCNQFDSTYSPSKNDWHQSRPWKSSRSFISSYKKVTKNFLCFHHRYRNNLIIERYFFKVRNFEHENVPNFHIRLPACESVYQQYIIFILYWYIFDLTINYRSIQPGNSGLITKNIVGD